MVLRKHCTRSDEPSQWNYESRGLRPAASVLPPATLPARAEAPALPVGLLLV